MVSITQSIKILQLIVRDGCHVVCQSILLIEDCDAHQLKPFWNLEKSIVLKALYNLEENKSI